MEKRTENIKDFDNVIQRVVREMETTHNCLIFVQTDGESRFLQVISLADGNPVHVKEIELCGVNESKWATATAIRKAFRN